jgi:hypothetical protein
MSPRGDKKGKISINYEEVVGLYRKYGGYDELLKFLGTTEAIKNTPTGDWLQDMFYPDDLLCLGSDIPDTTIRPCSTWVGMLKMKFLGFNRRFGWLSQNPYRPDATGRCDDGILERRYYVLESDITFKNKHGMPTLWVPYLEAEKATGFDFQAGIIRYLFENKYPIVSIVHSGGRSLHVWCRGYSKKHFSEATSEKWIQDTFARMAVLGCDTLGNTKSKFMRMPNPLNLNRKQPLLYYNPAFAAK